MVEQFQHHAIEQLDVLRRITGRFSEKEIRRLSENASSFPDHVAGQAIGQGGGWINQNGGQFRWQPLYVLFHFTSPDCRQTCAALGCLGRVVFRVNDREVDIGQRHGPTKEISLTKLNSERRHISKLFLGFNPLRAAHQLQCPRQLND